MELKSVSVTVQNFKCFADEPQGFATIKPFNVIIGRNNTGKSTLLDLIEYAVKPRPIARLGHRGQSPQVLIRIPATDQYLTEHIQNQTFNGEREGYRWQFNPLEYSLQKLVNKPLLWDLREDGGFVFVRLDYETNNANEKVQLAHVIKRLSERTRNPLAGLFFRRILADRDIVAEKSDGTLSIASNGAGVTNVIQQYINSDVLDRDLVERTLLGELNKIFYPDANYLRIMVQQQQRAGLETWEVYLEEAVKGRVPMSHTGSGLKTVLLVLANVLIAPLLDDRKPADYLFAFEELENNLHPAVQRRLFRYLRDKAANDGCHFFITTHSNVVIDMFSDDRKAQLLHVTHNSEHSTVATVETYKHGHGVLDDLDVRASDLLQTNAVVWVEGPSDRIYFNRWIELWTDNQLVEGIHYQCLTYGGSVNAHLSFLEPEAVDDLISALKINRHAILLIDRDVKPPGELKPHTQRLVDEIKTVGGYDWVTAGKEVENYIPIEALRTLLEKPDAKNPGSFANILEYIRKQKENKQQPRKVDLAHDVIKLLTKESIKATHDLAAQLTHVEGLIRKWNRIPTV